MSNSNDFRNAARETDPFSRQNRPLWGIGAKWVAAIVIVVAGIAIIAGPVGLALGWYSTGVQVISPDNVKTQFADAYSRSEDLKAIAGNVCSAQSVVDKDTKNNVDPSIASQHQDQLTAYQQNYRRIQAQYDAAYDNAFKAKLVGPGDLPAKAATLEEATANC